MIDQQGGTGRAGPAVGLPGEVVASGPSSPTWRVAACDA
jgi:hypothetical protein